VLVLHSLHFDPPFPEDSRATLVKFLISRLQRLHQLRLLGHLLHFPNVFSALLGHLPEEIPMPASPVLKDTIKIQQDRDHAPSVQMEPTPKEKDQNLLLTAFLYVDGELSLQLVSFLALPVRRTLTRRYHQSVDLQSVPLVQLTLSPIPLELHHLLTVGPNVLLELTVKADWNPVLPVPLTFINQNRELLIVPIALRTKELLDRERFLPKLVNQFLVTEPTKCVSTVAFA
jgi:hypothetical protein